MWLSTPTGKRRPEPVDIDTLLVRLGNPATGVEETALAYESGPAVRRALRGLPRSQARAVVLSGLLGLTVREIAHTESIPLGTAKTRIRAGLQRLRGDLTRGLQEA
jgi:RNA polymerase sigma-70 factor (ECF subfamily)